MKFKLSENFQIDSSISPWKTEGLRTGFFGAPGSGKSYDAAILVEQFLDQGGTTVIFQPRAEWHTLKERYGRVQVVGGPFNQDVPFVAGQPRLYADAVVNQGISMIFYTGDVEDEEDLVDFTSKFIQYLLKLEETVKRPILMVLEEAQDYAPRSSQGHVAPPWVYNRMIRMFRDCFTQGRKLNVSPMVISQRPQEINFTIRQLCNLTFYGKFSPQDMTYLDKECLKPYREKGLDVKATHLLSLSPGQWLVIHGSKAVTIEVTEKRLTPHGADTPTLEYVAKADEQVEKTVTDLGRKLQEMLEKQRVEESELEKAKRRLRDQEKEISDLREKVNIVGILKAGFGKANAEDKPETIHEKAEALTKTYDAEVDRLNTQLWAKSTKIFQLEQGIQKMQGLEEKFEAIKDIVMPKIIVALDGKPIGPIIPPVESMEPKNVDIVKNIPEYEHRIFLYLIQHRGVAFTKYQVSTALRLGSKSSRLNQAINRLKKLKLVVETREGLKVE